MNLVPLLRIHRLKFELLGFVYHGYFIWRVRLFEIINLNGITTTNIVPLDDGPSLFFAQRIDGNINECDSGTQTIQVAWNGGVTPYISGDTESDLFQYYIGYSDSSGIIIPHVPNSIADINDNDNFHHYVFLRVMRLLKFQ